MASATIAFILASSSAVASFRGDAAVLDRHIGPAWIVSKTVDDGGAADHEIVHRLSHPAERAIGGERCMVDDIADRGAHLRDLHRLGEAVDHRTDHRDAAQAL